MVVSSVFPLSLSQVTHSGALISEQLLVDIQSPLDQSLSPPPSLPLLNLPPLHCGSHLLALLSLSATLHLPVPVILPLLRTGIELSLERS